MTCKDVDQILSTLSAPPPGFDEHVSACPRCRGMVDFMRGPESDTVDAAVLERAQKAVLESLTPVRPLPASRVFVAAFLALFAAVAAIPAGVLGMHGWHALSRIEAVCIFPLLALLALAASINLSREMTPGSRRFLSLGALLIGGLVVLICVFAVLFRDYSMTRFLPAGLICLALGTAVAVPAAAISWFIAKRGFVLDRPAAGAAAGVLGGLTGLAMLELHCPNLLASHLLVWHVGVLILSGSAGWLLGRNSPTFPGNLGKI